MNKDKSKLTLSLNNTTKIDDDGNRKSSIVKRNGQENEGKPLSSFIINLVAGGGSGCIETVLTYPLDLVKTRLQLETSIKEPAQHQGKRYGRILGMIQDIVRQDGWKALYRGLSSPLISEVPRRAVKFSSNGYYTDLIKMHFLDQSSVYKDATGSVINPLTTTALLAGTFTGFTEAIFHTPFEVVKIRMQSEEYRHLKNSFECVKNIFEKEKLVGLFRGLESYLLRQGLWNGLYFGGITQLKISFPVEHFMEQKISIKGPSIEKKCKKEDTSKNEFKIMMHNFLVGLTAGSFATIVNTPLDVAKTRIQHQNTVQHTGTLYAFSGNSSLHVLKRIFIEEGFRACFKGCAARLIRSTPGSGVLLVFYEFFSSKLKEYRY